MDEYDVLSSVANMIATVVHEAEQEGEGDRFWYTFMGRRVFPRVRPLPKHPTLPRPADPPSLPRPAQNPNLPRVPE